MTAGTISCFFFGTPQLTIIIRFFGVPLRKRKTFYYWFEVICIKGEYSLAEIQRRGSWSFLVIWRLFIQINSQSAASKCVHFEQFWRKNRGHGALAVSIYHEKPSNTRACGKLVFIYASFGDCSASLNFAFHILILFGSILSVGFSTPCCYAFIH